jgi:hypothetical protein
MLLESRAAYLGRKDPTRWRRGDVRALLYDLAVPRLSEQCDLIAHTVPAVDAYLRFLDETGRLHPGSAAVKYLRRELAQHADGFPAAMADRSRFRMAKTLYQAMLVDGVHLDDHEAVDAWMARFNRASRRDRVAVLEHLLASQPELLTADFVARAGKVAALAPGRPPVDSRELLPARDRVPDVMPVFAPVEVPSQAEAAKAARRSMLIRDLLVLARWVGQGRKATKDGEPVPADVRSLAELLGLGLPGVKASSLHHVPSLKELFWLARQLELIDLRRTGLVAGSRLSVWRDGDLLTSEGAVAIGDDNEVLELWRQVFVLVESSQELPEEALVEKTDSADEFLEVIQRCVTEIMVSLYRSAALDQDRLLVDLISPYLDDFLEYSRSVFDDEEDEEDEDEGGEEEVLEAALRVGLCLPLDRLTEHGVVELSAPDLGGFPVSSGFETHGLPLRTFVMASSDQVWIRLTPLGRWAMREALNAEGAEAPAIESDSGDATGRVVPPGGD